MKLTYIGEAISYDVEIKAIKSNVLQVTGPGLMMKETGFILNDGVNDYDYSAYSTLYRTVNYGYQYSNNGEIWVEPTKTVTVSAEWNDDGDIRGVRPSSVKVSVFDNETSIGTVTLNAKNEWTKEYVNVPESHIYTISAPDVNEYTRDIENTTVIYNMVRPYEPSVAEQLDELTNAIIDLDERVYNLEGGN